MPIRKRERREPARLRRRCAPLIDPFRHWSAPEPELPKLWSALGISDDPQRQEGALQGLTDFAETYLQRQQQAGSTPSPAHQRRQLATVARGAEKLSVALAALLERHTDAQYELLLQNPQRLKGGGLRLSDLMIDLRSLQRAAIESQASLADRTGPHSRPNLHLLVIGLCQLYEEMTQRAATHNPNVKTRYDGKPHSAAGKFVQAAVKLIDPRVRATQINTALVYAIAALKRQRAPSHE
jgi:hypothetical protein